MTRLFLQVDVLVNTPASNIKDLTKCGKVCRVFCKAGGEQMQKVYASCYSLNVFKYRK